MVLLLEIGIVALIGLSSFISKAISLILLLLLLPLLFIQQKGFHKSKRNSQSISSKTMRAIIYDTRSKSELNFTTSHALPKYSSTQILIKVEYGAINPVDYKLVAPRLPFVRWFWSDTVGRDIAGIVIEVGADVKSFKPGDKVFGKALGGALQEYTVADSDEIALLPPRKYFYL